MPRSFLLTTVLIAGIAGGLLWRNAAVSQSTPAGITILLTLGLKATRAETWNGAARVHGGALTATGGHHFSKGDSVTGPGAWRASTRLDAIAPYADLHYTEMRPGSVPEVRHQPVGVLLTIQAGAATRVAVKTTQGNFGFALDDAGVEPLEFLGGRASVVRVPTLEKLTTGDYDDDEPSIAAAAPGEISVAWVAYRDREDRVLLRTRRNQTWSSPEEVTARPGDIFRTSVAAVDDGLWVFWSERRDARWQIWGRHKKSGSWEAPVQISSDGSNTFHRAASAGGKVYAVWQSFRDGPSDIYMRAWDGNRWSAEMQVSDSPANDWEPAVAASRSGAFVAWDGYDKGNYDVFFRAYEHGQWSPVRQVTTTAKFEAQASVAADPRGRPWVAWNESGVNWGKDQGFLIPVPLATPLHQTRTVRVASWDGRQWTEPVAAAPMTENAEHPQIVFDGEGSLQMIFRHWTRQQSRSIGSAMVWENYLTAFDGAKWTAPRPLPSSGGWIEKHAGLARDATGDVWAAWMTDNRPFATMIPANSDIFAARLGRAPASAPALRPLDQPQVEAIPVHNNEPADVRAIRDYTIASGAARYKIYRGDMHRHTDLSQDFKYDGSLIEVYRYGLDAAGFDYIAPTDHQTGYDQEYSWWQSEKLVDIFHVPGVFTPLFGTERSLLYPNGHRNLIFAQRGVRTLPIPPEEASGKTGAAKLFAFLKQNRGISMPHSSATNQGTDWRDNDPEVEPLVEIYQGYRTSYEYEGAPRAATTLNPHAQKSGWKPAGFWWNALTKGYRLGVQSSSDHWSTHISYACILAETQTREGLLDAIRKRHAYAATDNIILDFRAETGQASYIMGDAFTADRPPALQLRAIGTGAIKQVDLIKNRAFVYTARPGTKDHSFEFTDQAFGPGESWYYVRVLQEDGQIAWSSPIWVTKRP